MLYVVYTTPTFSFFSLVFWGAAKSPLVINVMRKFINRNTSSLWDSLNNLNGLMLW